ncbi:MAG: rod shape-determining protein MreC [Lentisphaerae bacterium]|nr:rod shape-determining protein MreC [Lentisphaerota bacterium]
MVRGRTYLILAVLVAVVVLLNLPAPVARRVEAGAADNLLPFQNVLTVLGRRARAALRAVSGGAGGREREAALRLEVASLRAALRALDGLEHENAALRRLLDFRKRSELRLAACEVMSRGGTDGWWEVVRLDRGTADGLKEGLAVMTADGLVGRTRAVSRHTADVLLITDPSSQVACRVVRVDAVGILRGGGVSAGGDPRLDMLAGARPLGMDYIRKDVQLAPGDRVVTSGLGGVFPAGLPVGRVERVALDASRLFQRAEITPAADLARLRYVFVVLP